jgi:mono/diheme cytochrome c family protein
MRRLVFLIAAGGSTFAAAMAADSSPRAHAVRTVWDSVYSATQAARGETAYVKSCARCHKESLGGADESPAIAGAGFLANWNGETVGALHERIRTTMPPDDPGSLNRQLVTEVTAYMLKMNGFPAGSADLPTDLDSLKSIAIRASKP